MVNWDLIVDTINSEKCVLVLGPEIRQNKSGNSINNELYQYINIQNNPNIIRFYENDELFLFQDGMAKTMVHYEIKKFLNNVEVADIYKKISFLPFHLIISINNDLFLPNTFNINNLSHNFVYYNKNKLATNVEPPSKNKPLIYNMMGCIENEESIILDYDDLMEFLFSVLGTKPLPIELKNSLQNASNFIFLGFSFEMKFLQIILKLLNFNMKQKLKFAFNKEQSANLKTFYIDQFKINFVDGGVNNFIDELYVRFEKSGKLRKQVISNQVLHERIQELVLENKLKQAINELKIHFSTTDESCYNTTIILLSRLNALEDSIIAGTVDNRDIDIERNRLRAAIIDMVNKIKET